MGHRIDILVIGGTEAYNLDREDIGTIVEEVRMETPYGLANKISIMDIGKDKLVGFMSRHGEKGYSVSGNGDANSKMKFFLCVAVGAVAFVGLVITLLAFYILVLSIYLLIEKNIEKLRNLLLIGYSPMAVSVPYIVLVCMVNLISVVLAVPVAFLLRSIYIGLLAPLFTDVAGEAVVWIPAVILFVLLTLMNSAVILCKIYRIRA